MADPSGGWISRTVDSTSFCCILVGVEEGARSLAHLGPTMPWSVWLSAFVIGVVLSFAGDKGPKLWHRLMKHLQASEALAAALAENADLKKRLAERPEPVAQVSKQKPERSPAAMQRFGTVQSRFDPLKLSQKVALKLIYTNHGTLRLNDLIGVLNGMEFREPRERLEYLLNNTSWIDQDFASGGRLSIAPAVIEDIGEILENAPLL